MGIDLKHLSPYPGPGYVSSSSGATRSQQNRLSSGSGTSPSQSSTSGVGSSAGAAATRSPHTKTDLPESLPPPHPVEPLSSRTVQPGTTAPQDAVRPGTQQNQTDPAPTQPGPQPPSIGVYGNRVTSMILLILVVCVDLKAVSFSQQAINPPRCPGPISQYLKDRLSLL